MTKSSFGMLDADFLVRPQNRRATAPARRRSTDRRRSPDCHRAESRRPDGRGSAARAACPASRAAAPAPQAPGRRAAVAGAAAADLRPASCTRDGFATCARVVAGMRHHPHFGVPELRIGLDPVDERRAARRRREQPLEHDQSGRCFQDRLQRLDRLGVGKRQEFALAARRSRSAGIRLVAAITTAGMRGVYHARPVGWPSGQAGSR